MTTRGEFGFVLERNAAYLAWRYDTESPRNYAVITKETDVGSVAAAVCGIGSGGVGQLTELLCRSGHEEDAVQVLQRTIQHLMEKGCHTVETLASTRETMRVLKSAGFFKVSKVLLIAHANDPKGADELRTLLGAERIMLSFGDSDLA